MKNGKINKASGFITVLLGLAVAGALLFASCQDIFDTSAQQAQKDDGYGYVIVDLGDWARTTRPSIDGANGFTKYVYTFTGVGMDVEVNYDSTTAVADAFRLPAGKYKLTVKAYVQAQAGTPANNSATGVYADGDGTFDIVVNNPTKISVKLTPVENGATTAKGTFTATITGPTNAKGVYSLIQYSGPNITTAVPIVKIDLNQISGATFTNGGIAFANAALTPGTYLFTGRINTDDGKYGGFSEAIHIVSYMLTTFERNYNDPTNPGALATITSSDEAKAILRDEIKDWLTPTPANVNVLASVSQVEYIDTTTPPTIRINYIGEQMKKLSVVTSPVSSPNDFPITLQGGWTLANDSWMAAPATPWTVNNYTGITSFKLVNTAVDTPKDSQGNITAYNTKYNVELRAVAEFQVSYGYKVDPTVRDIKISDVTLGAADKDGVRTGLGEVKSTTITAENAALMIDSGSGYTYAPLTGKDHTLSPADSKVYKIAIYETADDQVKEAIARLKREIAYKGDDKTITPWIQDTNVLAKANWQDDTTDASNPADNKTDTILYYVAERLGNGVTTITLREPTGDLRWAPIQAISLSDPTGATTGSTGASRTLTFTPWGGTSVTYDVWVKPVAEFIVDFYPGKTYNPDQDPDVGTNNPLWVNGDPDIASDGKLTIKDSGTSSTAVEYLKASGTVTVPNARFILSATAAMDITLTKVTIMIDEDDGSGNYVPKNAYKQNVTNNPIKNSDIVQETGTPYKLTGAVSRVYTIRVYPSIADQQAKAVAQLAAEEDSAIWTEQVTTWVSPEPGVVTKQRIEPFSKVTAGSGSTLPSSTIVYVGKATEEPTVRWPLNADYTAPATSPYIPANGWTGITQTSAGTAGAVAAFGSKSVQIKFKPKGGEPEDLYEFKLVRAVEYKIQYAKRPIGNALTTGTVSASVGDLGVNGTINPAPEYTGDTPSKNPIMGIGGSNLTFRSPTTQNILEIVGGTNTNPLGTTVTIASVVDTDNLYTIKVYPSITDQVADVRAALRAVSSLNSWTNTGSINTVDATTDISSATADKSTFLIITSGAAGTSIPAVLKEPSSFALNTGYTLTHTAGTSGTVTVNDPKKGFRRDTVKFLAIGGTPSGQGEITYTFDLYQVARYNVVFKNGPNKSDQFSGSVSITTYEPKTGAYPANNAANITLSSGPTPKSYLGGVGTDGKVAIESTTNNVFSTNILATGAKDTATANANQGVGQATPALTFSTTTGDINSDDFTIEIYPTLADQISQVRTMLSAPQSQLQDDITVTPNLSGWFSTIAVSNNNPVTTFVPGQVLTSVGSNVSEIQYFGTEPTVKIPAGFLQAGYTLVLAGAAAADGSDGWKKTTLNFTPIGSSSAAAVYDIRTIPVAKFTVQFSGGAIGQVTITPNSTTAKPKTAIVISDTSSTVTGYIGIGDTTIKFESASGNFTDVTIPIPNGTAISPAINSTAGVGVYTGTVSTTSQAYSVRVFKSQ